jgi:hypothetical protein
MAPEKIAAEPGHAEVPLRLVDAVGACAQFRHLGIMAGIAVQPRQHFGDRPTDELRIVVFDVNAFVFGEVARRMAVRQRLAKRFGQGQVAPVSQSPRKLRQENIRRMPRPHAGRPPIGQYRRHPVERRTKLGPEADPNMKRLCAMRKMSIQSERMSLRLVDDIRKRRQWRRIRIAHAHDEAAAAGYFGDRRQRALRLCRPATAASGGFTRLDMTRE